MPSSIDNKIVQATFDNKQFEKGIAESSKSLSLFDKLVNAAGKLSAFTGMNQQVGNVARSFNGLEEIATGALRRIGEMATNAGMQLAQSLMVKPVSAGFSEYELKLNTVRSIMNATGETAEIVEDKLNVLDEYADKTIYSTKDMFDNLATFTNAGIPLDKASTAMIGIANATAYAGQGTMAATYAYRNFSDAISNGHMALMDWRSISRVAKIGTQEFRGEVLKTAVEMGTLKQSADGTITTLGSGAVVTKNFEETLKEKWMTAEVVTAVLEKYGDATTEVGRKAWEAAQEVRTFSGMMEALTASVETGWAESFIIIFGGLEDAKSLWGAVNKEASGILGRMSDARNAALNIWADEGGREQFIIAMTNVLGVVEKIAYYISEASQTFFPKIDGSSLVAFSEKFRWLSEDFIEFFERENFGNKLKMGLQGFFAILDNGRQLVSGVADNFGALLVLLQPLMNGIGMLGAKMGVFAMKAESLGLFYDIGQNLVLTLEKIGYYIKEAFEEVIPLPEVDKMLNFVSIIKQASDNILEFFTRGKSGEDFKSTLKGIFAAFDLLGQVVYTVFDIVMRVAEVAFPLIGGAILKVTGFLGETIAAFDKFARETGLFETVANVVTNAIFLFGEGIKLAVGAIGLFGTEVWRVLQPAFQVIGTELQKAYSEIVTFASGMWSKVSPYFKDIPTQMNQLFAQLKSPDFQTKVLDFFNTTLEKIKTNLIFVGTEIKKFFTTLMAGKAPDMSAFSDWMTNLGTNIRNIGNLGDGIKAFFSNIAAEAEKLFPIIIPIKNFFGDVWTAIKDFAAKSTQDMGFSDWIDVINTTFFAGLVLAIRKFVDSLKEALGDGGIIAETLTSVQSALKTYESGVKAEAIFDIAKAVAALAASFIALSFVPADKLQGSMIVITTLFAELAGTYAIIQKVDQQGEAADAAAKKNPFASDGSVTLMLLGIAASVAILATAVSKMQTIDIDSAVGVVIALMGISTSILTMMKKMPISEFDQTKKKLAELLGLTLILGMLADDISQLAQYSWDQLLFSVLAIGAVLGELFLFNKYGGMNDVTASFGTYVGLAVLLNSIATALFPLTFVDPIGLLKAVLGIGAVLTELALFVKWSKAGVNLKPHEFGTFVGLAVILESIAWAVLPLSFIPLEGMIKAVVGIFAVLAELALFVKWSNAGKNIWPEQFGSFVGLAIILNSIVLAVIPLTFVQPLDLVKAVLGIGAVLTELALFVKWSQAGKNIWPDQFGSFVGLGVMLFAIAQALVPLTTIQPLDLLKAVVAMGAVLLELWGFITLTKKDMKQGIGDELIKMAGALDLMALALWGLSGVGLVGIATAVGALGLVFGELFLAGKFITPFNDDLDKLAGVFLKFSASAALIGVAAAAVAAALLIVSTTGSVAAVELVAAIGIIVVGLLNILPDIVDGIVQIGKAIIEEIKELAAPLGEVIVVLIHEILKVLAISLPEIITFLGQFLVDLLVYLGDIMGPLVDAVIGLIVKFFIALADGIRKYDDLIMDAIASVVEAILEFVLTAIQKLIALIPIAGPELAKGIESAKEDMRAVMVSGTLAQDAENMVVGGVIEPMKSQIPSIEASGKMLGEAGVTSIEGGLGGLFGVGEGGVGDLIGGLESGEGSLGSASSGLGGLVPEGLTGGMGDLFDLGSTKSGELINGLGENVSYAESIGLETGEGYASKVDESLGQKLPEILTNADETWSAFIDGSRINVTKFKDDVGPLTDGVAQFFNSAGEEIADADAIITDAEGNMSLAAGTLVGVWDESLGQYTDSTEEWTREHGVQFDKALKFTSDFSKNTRANVTEISGSYADLKDNEIRYFDESGKQVEKATETITTELGMTAEVLTGTIAIWDSETASWINITDEYAEAHGIAMREIEEETETGLGNAVDSTKTFNADFPDPIESGVNKAVESANDFQTDFPEPIHAGVENAVGESSPIMRTFEKFIAKSGETGTNAGAALGTKFETELDLERVIGTAFGKAETKMDQEVAEFAAIAARKSIPVGEAMTEGMGDGITSTTSVYELDAKIRGLMDHTVKTGKEAIESRSPAKVTAKEWGKPMAAGQAKGLEDNVVLVTDSVKYVMGEAKKAGEEELPEWELTGNEIADNFIMGVAEKEPEMEEEGKEIIYSLADGMIKGTYSLDAVMEHLNFKERILAENPNLSEDAKDIMNQFADGILAGTLTVAEAGAEFNLTMDSLAASAADALKATIDGFKQDMIDLNPFMNEAGYDLLEYYASGMADGGIELDDAQRNMQYKLDENFSAFNISFETHGEEAVQFFIKSMTERYDDFDVFGNEAIQRVIHGIRRGDYDLNKAMELVIKILEEPVKESAEKTMPKISNTAIRNFTSELVSSTNRRITKEKAALIASDALNEIIKLEKGAEESGKQYSLRLARGIAAMYDIPIRDARIIAEDVIEVWENGAPEAKPKGEKYSSNYGWGINSDKSKKEVKESVLDLSTTANDTLDGEAEKAKTSGEKVVTNYSTGISSQIDAALNDLVEVIKRAVNAIQGALDESPIKVKVDTEEAMSGLEQVETKIAEVQEKFTLITANGKEVDVGSIADGGGSYNDWVQISDDIHNATKDIPDTVLADGTVIRNSAQAYTDAMRAAQNEASRIANAATNAEIARQAAETKAKNQADAAKQASVTYNQTINSPKPVSRTDIYKDTRTLLASGKAKTA